MINFMTHRNTTVSFKPNANFVTGVNGAGKSSIMAAIIVCLGGSGSAATRGNAIKGYIKTGEHVGAVTVICLGCFLCHVIDFFPAGGHPKPWPRSVQARDLWRHCLCRASDSQGGCQHVHHQEQREYGIDFFAYASKLPPSTTEKVISHKKDELESILDHMNIQVDNPVTILNQDTAREFLKSNEPKKKYDVTCHTEGRNALTVCVCVCVYQYFMKGTTIDVLYAQLENIRALKDETEKLINRKSEVSTKMKKECILKFWLCRNS